MTQINNIQDLVRILQDHPEWLHTLRGLIISDDLGKLPERMQELGNKMDTVSHSLTLLEEKVDTGLVRLDSLEEKVDTGFARLEEKVDTGFARLEEKVDTGFARLDEKIDTGLNRLEGKLDNHHGAAYESKVARHIQSIAGQHLGLIAVRVLYGGNNDMNAELEETLTAAADNDSETFRQVNELLDCDLIISGRRRGSPEREYAVVEASVTVGDNDVSRAADRAAILAQITGTLVTGAAIGSSVPDAQAALAETKEVSAITYSE